MIFIGRSPSFRKFRKGGKERQGTKSRCPFYKGVRLIDMSVKRVDYMGHVVGINMRD